MIYPSWFGTPKEDSVCRKFADYLKEQLNISYPSSLIVRTAIDWNITPHPSLCPLIKVYRQRDSFQNGTHVCRGSGNIEYILAYPTQKELPGVCSWMGKMLNHLLLQYQTDHLSCSRPDDENFFVSYGILVNESQQPVYSFVRANFNILDS